MILNDLYKEIFKNCIFKLTMNLVEIMFHNIQVLKLTYSNLRYNLRSSLSQHYVNM